MFDHRQQFADAVYRDTGAVIEPEADGTLHRFDDPNGKRHNRACWYVMHLDGLPAGAYGNWRTGFQSTWRGHTDCPVSPEESERAQSLQRQALKQRQHERVQAQAAAASRAAVMWGEGMPATVQHPYLGRKRIPALGLRQHGDALVVPLRTVSGELVNLQRIYPDGVKRFLKGGQTIGAFWLSGRTIPDTGTLYLCEGVATAATVSQSLCGPVVAAMTAGNLLSVAEAIRAKYSALALVVATDNDHRTPGNPGMTKGAEAARKVQGQLTWPSTCREPDCVCTDFNDTANCGRVAR